MPSTGALAYADEIDSGRLFGQNVYRAGILGLLTDANVVAASTVDDLIASMETNALTLHYDTDWSQQEERALTFSEMLGDITDAVVVASSTVQQLVDATAADAEGLAQGMTIE